MGNSAKSFIVAVLGLLYGAALAIFGLGASNGGDGPMLPLYVFGSPLFFPLLFYAPIVVWLLVGMLLSRVDETRYRRIFFVVIGVHYLGIIPYAAIVDEWSQLERLLYRSWVSVAFLISLYLCGQVAMWMYFTKKTRDTDQNEPARDERCD